VFISKSYWENSGRVDCSYGNAFKRRGGEREGVLSVSFWLHNKGEYLKRDILIIIFFKRGKEGGENNYIPNLFWP